MITREPTTPGNYFIYNGVNSADYGVFISGNWTFVSPQRDVSTVSVPGRSGDIIFDNNRFANIDITIPCFIPRGFMEKFDNFKAAILSDTGYHRLELTHDPEHFRQAYVVGPIEPVTGPGNKSGKFDIVFRCKPQRYLKIGERTTDITAAESGTTIYNRTMFIAQPRIQVKGTGSFRFRGAGITEPRQIFNVKVNQTTETGVLFLDSENGNAYYERVVDGFRQKVSVNHWIQTDLSGFPMIRPGANFVYVNGSIEWLRILPRWWTL